MAFLAIIAASADRGRCQRRKKPAPSIRGGSWRGHLVDVTYDVMLNFFDDVGGDVRDGEA